MIRFRVVNLVSIPMRHLKTSSRRRAESFGYRFEAFDRYDDVTFAFQARRNRSPSPRSKRRFDRFGDARVRRPNRFHRFLIVIVRAPGVPVRRIVPKYRARVPHESMDKVVVVSRSFDEADRADKAYYRSLTPHRRLEIMLELNRRYPRGDQDESSARLQRVYRIIKFT